MTPVEKLNQDLSKLVHAIRYVSFAFGKRSLDESLQNEAGKSILTTKVDFALVYKVVKNNENLCQNKVNFFKSYGSKGACHDAIPSF